MTKILLLVFTILLFTWNNIQAQYYESYYVNKQHYGTYRVPDKSSKTYRLDYQLAEITRLQIEGRIRDEKRRLGLIGMKDERYANEYDDDDDFKTTTTTSKPTSPVKRFETIKWKSGNVYTGYTLDGIPHGPGSITFPASKMTMKGIFEDGQANGMMEISGTNYVQKGIFKDGVAVGEQRYEYDDGKQKFVETRNLDKGTTEIKYLDKTSFDGVTDDKGEYIKGKITYLSGITFDGEFKDGRPFIGVWHLNGRTLIGEFGENGPAKLFLKYGFSSEPKEGLMYGSFTNEMKKIGYIREISNSGVITQKICKENEVEEHLYVSFPSGNFMSLKANQEGHDYIGTFYEKQQNTMSVIIYSKKDGIQDIPDNIPLYEKAIACSREVASAINTNKKVFEEKFEKVKPIVQKWLDDQVEKEKSK